MSDLLKRRISRRGMVKGAAASVAAMALAGCQPKIVEVTKVVEKVVKETVVSQQEAKPSGEQVVRYMTQLWNWQKLNMANATDEYNRQMRGKVRIEADPNPEGWQTKVVQMVRDNKLEWNGMLRVFSTSGETRDYLKMGILQPWDEFINSSKVAWASKFWDELLPPIKQSFTFDGKLYALPWDHELFVRVYRKPEWDKLGETPAETLADFENQLLKLKKLFPDNIPMGLWHWGQTPDQHMLMQLWTDKPWVQEGELGSFLDVRGDAYKQTMEMLKRWFSAGIITDDSWGGKVGDNWNKGLILTCQAGAGWLMSTARKVHGAANIVPTTTFVLNKGDKPKTLTFNNGAVLFKGAKQPQEVTDWLLWMVDPTVPKVDNYSFHLGYLNYYHFPVYKSVYDKIIPSNPDWTWMSQMYNMVAASVSIPSDAHLYIFDPISVAWEQKFLHGQASLQECIDHIYDEERAEVKKGMSGTK